MINKEYIDKLTTKLSMVKIESYDLKYSLESLQKDIDRSIRAHAELKQQKLLGVSKIATKIEICGYGTSLIISLYIPWYKQTMARHLYGGCFPGYVERDVTVENRCPNDVVFRRYLFKNGNTEIRVKFYRDTFDGDKVDGCKIETVYVRPVDHSYYPRIQSTPHLSISCPMKKGEYRYG